MRQALGGSILIEVGLADGMASGLLDKVGCRNIGKALAQVDGFVQVGQGCEYGPDVLLSVATGSTSWFNDYNRDGYC